MYSLCSLFELITASHLTLLEKVFSLSHKFIKIFFRLPLDIAKEGGGGGRRSHLKEVKSGVAICLSN